MTYGLGTRSYNRSTERREMKRQVAETTERYLRGELGVVEVTVGPICNCRSFGLPHEIKKHSELRADYDWRLPGERRPVYHEERPR